MNYLSMDEVVTELGLKDATELRRLVFEGKMKRPTKVVGWQEGYISKLKREKLENGD